MKIAVTITDAGMALNVGGPVSQETAIIEIPDENLPYILRKYLQHRDQAIVAAERAQLPPHLYATCSFSLVDERLV